MAYQSRYLLVDLVGPELLHCTGMKLILVTLQREIPNNPQAEQLTVFSKRGRTLWSTKNFLKCPTTASMALRTLEASPCNSTIRSSAEA